MEKINKKIYVAPLIRSIAIEMEHGIAAGSSNLGDGSDGNSNSGGGGGGNGDGGGMGSGVL
ncbi:MAG: hypothetical protein LBJ04_16110 [Sphingobacterium sp.]|jgi:hypothetical protein|nr:hypothetical protein [Sphingobacterium sp.]